MSTPLQKMYANRTDMNRGLFSIIGFALIAIGLLSIILKMIGLTFAFLSWMESFGTGSAFLMKIGMVVVGMIILYLAQSDFEAE